uniref:Uncharacterized protein n=1 Tax=Hanusia phi TaxID=3032 RepID=A0A7S0HHR1_9CRYP
MWNVKVSKNDPQRCLGPQSLDPSLRRPRLGSFEILLSWGSSNWSSGGGGRQCVVLFSKLNTLKFPNPPDVIDYLVRVLSGARVTQFELMVRSIPEGLPCAGALIEVHDYSTEEQFYPTSSHTKTDARGLLMLHLPFRKNLTALAKLPAAEGAEAAEGSATFDVHGELSKNICIPLVPSLPDGQVRIVLTWAEFPHEVFLKVKTPEGNIKSPSSGVGDLDIPREILLGQQEHDHSKFEVGPSEGGFGPISVLLTGLVPGRYHIYAHCEAYKIGGRDISWSSSNAELRFYTAEDVTWDGSRSFNCCGREEAGSWWDICFLEVSASGSVSVRSFNELKLEEPGFRDFLLKVVDLDGMLVPGAKVQVQPESSTQVGDFGVSDSQGEVLVRLEHGNYTASAAHEYYMPMSVSIKVDLEPQEGSATIPLVRPDFFHRDSDLCFILSWGGGGSANLHMETPGRSVRVEEEETLPGSDKSMRMIGKNPRSCLLREADEQECPWLSDSASRRTNRALVSAAGSMELWNMQVTVCSKEGILHTFLPTKSSAMIKSATIFWDVCSFGRGGVVPVNNIGGQDPAGGRLVTVRINQAKSDSDLIPSAQVLVKKADESVPLRIFPAPLTPEHPEYTRHNEVRFFCEWGKFEVEVRDDKCHSPLVYSNLLVSNQIQPSVGFCMAAISDLDAKQAFITLSWASSPKDLDLCLCNQDGMISSMRTESRAPSLKNIRYETAIHEGFGPKVISLTQSMSGKFKLYVMNREDNTKIFASNPLVTIVLFNGVWKTFNLDAQSCLDRAADKDEKLCCWHVCDLRIESDSRFSEQSIQCEDVNKILDHEVKFD